MKINYLLIGLIVLIAVMPQMGFAQGGCLWSYSTATDICNVNSGNVGIGTTTPDEQLVLYNSAGETWLKIHTAFETAGGIIFEDHGEESPWEREVGRLYNDGGTMVAELPHDGALFSREEYPDLRIDAQYSRVGVGVSSPQQTLHVKDVLRLEPQSSAPSGGLGDLYAGTDGHLYFHNGSSWQEVK